MSAKCFVLNEWIIHDLRGENGATAQEQAGEFLERLKTECDEIAVLEGSPWMRKAYQLMECTDVVAQQFSRYFHLNILRDSSKCRIIRTSEVREVPEQFRRVVDDDDFCLIETYYSAGAMVIVTSDRPFYERVAGVRNAGIHIMLRDEFIQEYL